MTTISQQDWISTPEAQAVMEALNLSDGAAQALFVGGCVRNALLGVPVSDVDIATRLVPEEVIRRLKAEGIKTVPTGLDHGTVTAVVNKKHFEITTLRQDVETDGRHAVVAFTQDWAEDARRRDFTMNTLLADREGNVFDPTGEGLADVKTGTVRFVGDPAQRITEDYLRILRFFRFYAQYGRGEADQAALQACEDAASHIPDLSKERITQEFLKILMVDDPVDVLKLMFEHKVLEVLPKPGYDPEVLRSLCRLQKTTGAKNIASRLIVLSDPERLSGLLILCNVHKKSFEAIEKARSDLSDLSEKSWKILIYKYNLEYSIQSVLLFISRGGEGDSSLISAMRAWEIPAFPLSGEDAKDAGIEEGPEIGQALKKVETWWIENDFTPDRSACLARLKA